MPNRRQHRDARRPILFVDVDGVISLFGFDTDARIPGRLQFVEGILHCIGDSCGALLRQLERRFELVWATGWEEKANEHLAHVLEIPELPTLSFDGRARFGTAHWKVEAIEAYAGTRPLAWIDDSIDEACERWAQARDASTLLIRTDSSVGIEQRHVDELLRFAQTCAQRAPKL